MNATFLEPIVASGSALIVDGRENGRLTGLVRCDLPANPFRIREIELDGVASSAGTVEKRPLGRCATKEVNTAGVQILGEVAPVGYLDNPTDARLSAGAAGAAIEPHSDGPHANEDVLHWSTPTMSRYGARVPRPMKPSFVQ